MQARADFIDCVYINQPCGKIVSCIRGTCPERFKCWRMTDLYEFSMGDVIDTTIYTEGEEYE